MDCKTCGKPVVPKKGAKRPKLYCNETCRSNHWHRERAQAKTKAEEESRNNQFTNAARGRDKNGVNNDETKVQKKGAENISVQHALKIDGIRRQIEAIKSEKIPKDRDTILGRKGWAMDQQKRIKDLEDQLK